MAGYLSSSDIQLLISKLAVTYPAFASLITLPKKTHGGQTIRALRIGSGGGSGRRGVLLLGGTHARELINPDLLVSFAYDLCDAYDSSTSLTYGTTNKQTYGSSLIEVIVDTLDLFIVPLVNPDGRDHVLAPLGDPMWRKNRNPNSGLPCEGVDVNRNFDFLWSTGIGSSSSACDTDYKGASALSEPEAANVRYLLDTYPGIGCMIDVHSYGELILFPWGHALTQTTNSAMNFRNPIYAGAIGGSSYQEYMEPADQTHFVNAANRMQGGIKIPRGRSYTVQPSYSLYPTTGTSDDYAYSRHLVNVDNRKVHAYTIETGTQFQPPYSEAEKVMEDVSVGLMEFLLNCICPVEAASVLSEVIRRLLSSLGSGSQDGEGGGLAMLREFRDREMLASPAGRRYVSLLRTHQGEIVELMLSRPELLLQLGKVLPPLARAIAKRDNPRGGRVGARIVSQVRALMKAFEKTASPALQRDLAVLREESSSFEDVTVREGLDKASGRKPSKREKKPRKSKTRS